MISTQGDFLLTHGDIEVWQVHETRTGKIINLSTENDLKFSLEPFVWSPSNLYLLQVIDTKLYVWNLRARGNLQATHNICLEKNTEMNWVFNCQFSSDDSHILINPKGHRVFKIFDIRKKVFVLEHDDFSRTLLSGSPRSILADWKSFEYVHWNPQCSIVISIEFYEECEKILTFTDILNGKVLSRILVDKPVTDCIFSTDGKTILVKGEDDDTDEVWYQTWKFPGHPQFQRQFNGKKMKTGHDDTGML
eukprot:CAMPEP_0117740688 /NCGR_PEP_ID=MMETSP0947-20121206/4486_1 /TAXON_ID=44440 /ORGANISM="Chattonella subsalsa, Strain CCMP2191" /LENGTH=248 /DNA_ID=CAMNT_0005556841 /DNA_START=542 /DNA_END=1288 /DNA_ORIENTATION=+